MAQFNLSNCYFYGEGVKEDETEVLKWLRKAAKQGHVSAQYNLGICYEVGYGVRKNMKTAAEWYRKAAELGDEKAKEWLEENGLNLPFFKSAK